MKSVMVCMLLLLGTQVFAHPGDDSSILAIDRGAKLIVHKDFNMPSTAIYLQKGRRIGNPDLLDPSLPYCVFGIEGGGRDSVLRKGSELVFRPYSFNYIGSQGYVLRTFFTKSHNSIVVGCAHTRSTGFANHIGTPSIGEFREIIAEFMTLELPEPLELQ